MKEPEKIEKSYVLLCEGNDEVHFIDAFLEHLGIDEIQVREVGGRDQFPVGFPLFLIDPGFSKVKAYAIIRDADDTRDNVLDSVKGLLRKHKQPVPQEHAMFESDDKLLVGIFIMPAEEAPGALEDLCLDVVEDSPSMNCVNLYMGCLRELADSYSHNQSENDCKAYRFPANDSKAKVLTYLAGLHDDIRSIGIAAKKGVWDFNSNRLAELKRFIDDLLEKG